MPLRTRHDGHTLFAQYAYPPNELGYCGPVGLTAPQAGADLGARAGEFDGAWPYLAALAAAAGTDILDGDVVHDYWIGGALLDAVDPGRLLTALRRAFRGQVTGLLDAVPATGHVRCHHSFHVFVVYPWIRFLDRDPATPLHILQNCRIRWGTVESVSDDHAALVSRPLTLDGATLALGAATGEHVRWRRDGDSLISAPRPGDRVAAHWDWACGTLTDDDVAALTAATQATLDLVNDVRTLERS
ncbi:hypothetical protein AU195_01320 [Mycobacterium sp. IS-1496]|uniref:DUF6390 family protein n=1 Tax=Mycobacterium sp. IS-1496 TaxID=1772284 RepID=UPI000741512C|nr:DUF6390 family protein [Mycobacterium sp. IS-1496]KUI24460.1 hypothetical protein AU195_01320 [Mycobacterium sp. IS-1496]